MLKKTITYEDYNGEERTEDFYFNLTKFELSKLEINTPGGIEQSIRRMSQVKDYKGVMDFVDNLVKMSYGIKSEDGRKFVKDEAITKDFMETEAYSELMMEFLTPGGDGNLAAFIEGILPQKLVEEIKLEQARKDIESEKKMTAQTAETSVG